MDKRPRINEAIVVEGRNDARAVREAVQAPVIVISGYAISERSWKLLEAANQRSGLIILTDPDHAGEQIRSRLSERFPTARHAFLEKAESSANCDIGIEHAAPDRICKALLKARAATPAEAVEPPYTIEDLRHYRLAGTPGCEERRNRVGARLGIGAANAKTFVSRLNLFAVRREEFDHEAAKELCDNQPEKTSVE
ncbi:MAG TPA: ribonuclease M5 [Clostridiales bacterium]|jgi:ribonuclease M5|nr:ribonuclease M5 [Clostridiales bacterium]